MFAVEYEIKLTICISHTFPSPTWSQDLDNMVFYFIQQNELKGIIWFSLPKKIAKIKGTRLSV